MAKYIISIKEPGTNTQEVAMMITNLLEQYPEITIEMLTRK